MREQLDQIARVLDEAKHENEVYVASFQGERSDFVRFNEARVRQAGTVEQAKLELDLIEGRRHASATLTLSGEPEQDATRLRALLERLRELRSCAPEDPHLQYSTAETESERSDPDRLPDATEVTGEILGRAADLDLVGIYAAGSLHAGFANSFGARHWQTTHSFHFDWSLFEAGGRAVKSSYGGFEWSDEALEQRLVAARDRLEVLRRPAHALGPGPVRAYLSPAAMAELMTLLCWGGFGLRSHRTKTTPLLRMIEDGTTLDARVTISEATADGIAPPFQEAGYPRPDRVPLIESGRLVGTLVSPRSAAEYRATTNGAAAFESPLSLAMEPGDMPCERALSKLGTGIAIGNLWYLNYSDRSAGRITGMTRFATFWVENGEIVAPLEVMRFDDTIFRMLGTQLEALTSEAEMIFSAETYDRRSVESMRLPGAVLKELTLVA